MMTSNRHVMPQSEARSRRAKRRQALSCQFDAHRRWLQYHVLMLKNRPPRHCEAANAQPNRTAQFLLWVN
jgi:hypothetical protein